MNFEIGDKVKITKVVILSDTVKESVNLLNKVAYITEIVNNRHCYIGTYENYNSIYISGYKLNIGQNNWIWGDEELQLLNSYNKDKIQSEIQQVKDRLVELTN